MEKLGPGSDADTLHVLAMIPRSSLDVIVDAGEGLATDPGLGARPGPPAPCVAIFMGMQMPRLNGLDATRKIRQLPGYREIPIIALTANAFAEDRAQCLESGMNDVLIKLFIPGTLFATLLPWLRRRDS